ncbi:MAG TPA: prepilin-type N-terminal cleavage/methylation domain-containing protein [Sedimentisphaerales bacterium]|jgi:prepilin-type N-terminal cleavage/methylation domain-containing protein/prepilin-type processing-associated H-X9-DG protein|nr:prepilin-type N-terminal cleavage/methylation domain-containing protein [Sedimentisphaerales bacterium]HNU29665.1 prepilin-type N-terminal cleavage/methylation domain-containing protein [Sedimentisphaerales bacterium]
MARGARERNGRRSRGFTLIELLVVVSIICLLLSVMLPSLTRAQKQGEQLHCLGNQHQLFLTWMLYVTKNDDRLCESLTSLRDGAPSEDIFICKTVQQDSARSRGTSYGLSNTMGGAFRDGVQPYERFHKISHAGDSMVFTDIQGFSAECFWPLLRDHELTRWLWRPPDLAGLGGITSRHGSGCNMTFADGHGEMVRWKDQRTLQLIKGTIADEIEASQDNPDLDYLVRILVGDRPIQDESDEGESTDGI